MASAHYNSFFTKLARGTFDFDNDTFYAMLVDDSYTPDVDAHDFRDDVTGEVTGDGYTAGGAEVTCTLTQDDANNRASITLTAVTWADATLTGVAGAVIYKRNGGASSADELVTFVEAAEEGNSTNANFTFTFGAPIHIAAAA